MADPWRTHGGPMADHGGLFVFWGPMSADSVFFGAPCQRTQWRTHGGPMADPWRTHGGPNGGPSLRVVAFDAFLCILHMVSPLFGSVWAAAGQKAVILRVFAFCCPCHCRGSGKGMGTQCLCLCCGCHCGGGTKGTGAPCECLCSAMLARRRQQRRSHRVLLCALVAVVAEVDITAATKAQAPYACAFAAAVIAAAAATAQGDSACPFAVTVVAGAFE